MSTLHTYTLKIVLSTDVNWNTPYVLCCSDLLACKLANLVSIHRANWTPYNNLFLACLAFCYLILSRFWPLLQDYLIFKEPR